jgi:hypothetical protein
MEQLEREHRGEMRGAMSEVSMADVETFYRRWEGAGAHLVQHWAVWESEAAKFFGVDLKSSSNSSEVRDGVEAEAESVIMHGVMKLVRSVVVSPGNSVKHAMRETDPLVLEMAEKVLGHLGTFSAVICAERRFRAGELAADWSLSMTGGRAIVRSEFRGPKKEVEH